MINLMNQKQNNSLVNIMIVDDDAENIRLISNFLRELGYRLLFARDGESALQKLEHTTPDLILMDVIMPIMDGFETCRRIKAKPITQEIPVIFMTSLTDITSKVKGFQAGGVDYLSKPLQFEEVRMRVENHLKIHFQQKTLEEQTQEEVALNEELTAMNEELMALNEELRVTRDYLIQSEKMTALGNLVAGLAHEINTPLGVAITASSYLADLAKKEQSNTLDEKNFRADVREASELISDNLLRVGKLVRNFKTVSVDQALNEKREFNFKEYLEELIFSLKPLKGHLEVDIHLNCEETLKVNTYPGELAQIFTNLIQNAYIHGFESVKEKRIDINAKVFNQHLIIKFKDNGIGMEEQMVSRIFDPFFTTKRTKGSLGLGLYLVYNIITQKLSGTIKCVSDLGVGTTFDIMIPLYN